MKLRFIVVGPSCSRHLGKRECVRTGTPSTAVSFSLSHGAAVRPRFAVLLMIIFASVGLILVTVRVYSVLAYTTARKTHEIGIRMALGAERANVLRLVIVDGVRWVLAGVAAGLAISFLLERTIEAQQWPE